MRADAKGHGLFIHNDRLPLHVDIDAHLAPASFSSDPGNFRQFFLAIIPADPRLHPGAPVSGEIIATISHHKIQFARALQIHIDIHGMPDRFGCHDMTLKQGLGTSRIGIRRRCRCRHFARRMEVSKKWCDEKKAGQQG